MRSEIQNKNIFLYLNLMCDCSSPPPITSWLWTPGPSPTIVTYADLSAAATSAGYPLSNFYNSWPSDPTNIIIAVWECIQAGVNCIGYIDASKNISTQPMSPSSTAAALAAECVSIQANSGSVICINGQYIGDIVSNIVPANNCSGMPCCPQPIAAVGSNGSCQPLPVTSNSYSRCNAWTTSTLFDRTTCNFGKAISLTKTNPIKSAFSNQYSNQSPYPSSITPELCKVMYAIDFPEDPILTDAQAIKMWGLSLICNMIGGNSGNIVANPSDVDSYLTPGNNQDGWSSIALRNMALAPPAVKCFYFEAYQPYEGSDFDSRTFSFTYDFRFSTSGPGGSSDSNYVNYYDAQVAVEQYLAGTQNQPIGICGQFALPQSPIIILDPSFWMSVSILTYTEPQTYFPYLWFASPPKNDSLNNLGLPIMINPLYCLVDANKHPITTTSSANIVKMVAGNFPYIESYSNPNVVVSQLSNRYWGQQGNQLINTGNAIGATTGYTVFPLNPQQQTILGTITYKTDSYNTCVYQCNQNSINRSVPGTCIQACAGMGGSGALGTIVAPNGKSANTGNYYYNKSCIPIDSSAQPPFFATQALCEIANGNVQPPIPPGSKCPDGSEPSCYVYDSSGTPSCKQVDIPTEQCTGPGQYQCLTACCAANGSPNGCPVPGTQSLLPLFIIVGLGLLAIGIIALIRWYMSRKSGRA